jgi:p-aminobenzoyl-glutamate transporter AbgT
MKMINFILVFFLISTTIYGQEIDDSKQGDEIKRITIVGEPAKLITSWTGGNNG